MDSRDIALQSVAPTVMVPHFGDFTPLAQSGHRFLAAADGLWLEVRRPWLYLRRQLAAQDRVPMPYGRVQATLETVRIPASLVSQFVAAARERLPNEVAAWVIWQEATGDFALRLLTDIHASPGSVHFHRPALSAGEHLVLDLHSHANAPAYFSTQDDADDLGEVKFAGVVGNLDREAPDFALRLCAMGYFESVSISPDWEVA